MAGPGADPAILPIVFVLSGVGITMLTRLNEAYAVNQVIWLFLSVAAMVGVLFVVRNLDKLAEYKYTLGIVGVALLLLPMLVGTEKYGSKLWVGIGSFSFQPGEFAKILIVLFLAFYLAANREALSVSMRQVGPSRFRASACSCPCSSCGASACCSSSLRGTWAAPCCSLSSSSLCCLSPRAASATSW